MKLRPTLLRCGPDPASCKVRMDLELDGDHTVEIILDVAHARALSMRLDEIISGRVMARPPSRRVFNLALFDEDDAVETADTLPPPPLAAAGGDRR